MQFSPVPCGPGCSQFRLLHLVCSTQPPSGLSFGSNTHHSIHALWRILLECFVRIFVSTSSLCPLSIGTVFIFRSIPVWLVWLKYLSWFLYSNELLMINQWDGVEMDCDRPFLPGNSTGLACKYFSVHIFIKLKKMLICLEGKLMTLHIGWYQMALIPSFIKVFLFRERIPFNPPVNDSENYINHRQS